MSTIGLGVDIVELDRINGLLGNHRSRFIERCYRSNDLGRTSFGRSTELQSLSGSWAAKEAFMKALGKDLRRVPYKDIELVSGSSGGVSLNLYGVAMREAKSAGVQSIVVDISWTSIEAVAMVILGDELP